MSKTQRWFHAEARSIVLIAGRGYSRGKFERAIRTVRFNLTHWSDTRSGLHWRINQRAGWRAQYPHHMFLLASIRCR